MSGGPIVEKPSRGRSGDRLDETVFGQSVSKTVANWPFLDSHQEGKAPEPVEDQGLDMVAGARYTHQKTIFPPVEVIDIKFEYQGNALVPVKA
jgi:hypothetical protein